MTFTLFLVTILLVFPMKTSLEIARKERRVLIVADRDFGELIFQQGLAHAGVIFFRRNYSLDSHGALPNHDFLATQSRQNRYG
jgi:hypothetical protein